MKPQKEDEEADQPVIECASPPCLLHEVDPAYSGLGEASAAKTQSPKQRAHDEAGTETGEMGEQDRPSCPEPPPMGPGT